MQFAQQQQHRVERSAAQEATMNYSNWRSDRLVLAKVAERRTSLATGAWERVVSVLTSGDVVALTIFCMIGLPVGLAMILTVPGFSESVEAIQQYL
jgi:hypothetical protein